MTQTVGTFFKLLEVAADEAACHADAFDRLRAGELHGILIRDVYDPQLLAGVVERLEHNDPQFVKSWFPAAFRSWFFGRNLNLTAPDLREYFADAQGFDEKLASLFPAGQGIVERLGGLLSALDRGRPFCAPPGPENDQRYMFTTIRAHLEEGYIPAHCDNEQALRPSFHHMRQLVDGHMTSFVLPLSLAVEGGALEVFDYRQEPVADSLMNDDRATEKPDPDALESVRFRLVPGTAIVVDSGRYLHRVTPVEGPRKRWAACSFMALSREGDAVYCWG